jgi:glutaminyl-tRNA synthetase
MRDPAAFRIKFKPHPHIGDKWCIYPTYDYTHCLVDSLENITHSLCTLEFEIRRDSYYWVLEALDMYRPYVWEYSRLNITNTVLSKRKLEKLVTLGLVRGWDDPRLHTLNGLRRRGYTPTAINEFCERIGVTRAGNDKMLSIKLLEYFIRKESDETAPRDFMILDPIKLVITNFKKEETITAPLFPIDPSKGNRNYKLGKEVLIDRDDFREEVTKGFWGLAPGQHVILRYGPKIELKEIVRTASGDIDHVKVEILENYEKKIKGVVHWISEKYSHKAEARLYNHLFLEDNVNNLGDTWLDHVNPESLIVKPEARIWNTIKDVKEYDRF